MKKIVYSYLLLALIFGCGVIQPVSILANDTDYQASIETRADIIEWRYKIENGKLYKRLYNATKNEWIGDWILA